eukprot:10055847-Heterocapsa_arctica.AAC.1
MEVDQEGEGGFEPEGDHGTEEEYANQENLDLANQHQYDAAPSGGWNHELVDLTQAKERPVIDLEVEFDIRGDILNLGLKIYEAILEASARDDVRK